MNLKSIHGLLAALMLTTAGQAQTTTFKTYTIKALSTGEGTFQLPFEVRKVDSDEFYKARDAIAEYVSYMQGIARSYLGYEQRCHADEFIFLPGKTESAFRASEKAFNKVLTVNGYQRSTGESGKYLTKKTIPVKKLSKELTGSFYIFKPTVYPKTSPDANHQFIFGYFFNTKLSTGTLISCSFNPRK